MSGDVKMTAADVYLKIYDLDYQNQLKKCNATGIGRQKVYKLLLRLWR